MGRRGGVSQIYKHSQTNYLLSWKSQELSSFVCFELCGGTHRAGEKRERVKSISTYFIVLPLRMTPFTFQEYAFVEAEIDWLVFDQSALPTDTCA